MAVHFNWTQFLPGVDHHNIHIATASVVTLGLIAFSLAARASLGKGEEAIIPAGKLSIKGFFEAMIEFICGLVDMVIGKEGRVYVPLFASIFTYIWINNLVGLLPGMTPATDNVNTTLAVGLFSFGFYNYIGIREKGFSYWKDFTGHLPLKIWFLPLIALMIIIELFSHIFRPLTLGLRLYGNMTGDHTVLSVFLELLPSPFVYFIPIIFYTLGLLVCFIQAFVFTLLSMTYVMLAQAHEDH